MTQKSNIAWTDATWNPVHGCSKVSAGCDNCYAERISRQYGHTTEPWDLEHADENVTLRPDKLDEPRDIQEPTRIFVNSMSDLYHSLVPREFIQDVRDVIEDTPQHTYQILTKRPGRAAHLDITWPDNAWIGTSVENQDVKPRIDMLRDINATTRFISFEPLIGPIGDVVLTGIDWAIVGGESGPEYREMRHEWAADIYRQCRAQDVAFFFKQSAGPRPERGTRMRIQNEEHGLSEQRRIQEFPRVTNGGNP